MATKMLVVTDSKLYITIPEVDKRSPIGAIRIDELVKRGLFFCIELTGDILGHV